MRGSWHIECVLVLLVACAVTANSGRAELIRGFGDCSLGAWDFSDSAMVPLYEGDLTVIQVIDENYLPHDFVIAFNDAGVVRMFARTLDDVTEAPADPTVYVEQLDANVGAIYVVRTAEKHYAKFRILNTIPGYFEYVYQTDGTRILSAKLPADASTWGRIKSLFR